MKLKELFFSVFENITTNTLFTEECFLFLVKKYSATSRYYHNLDHLEFMFQELEQSETEPINKQALILSIFYHDIIYKSTKQDNEYQSSLILEKHLSQTNFKHLELSKNQIIATKKHQKSPIDPDTNLLIDLDLSILGQHPDIYEKYVEQVRKEYRIYPNIIYEPGRKKVLQHFLEQDSIFKTVEFIAKYESCARKNIQSEIKLL